MDARTVRTYDDLAREYDDETAGFWETFPATSIDAFAARVPSGGAVLSVGSGPGRDALLLQRRRLRVTCLDASAAMVRMSAERGLESVQGDFSALPFSDASFDGVWAYTSLLHVPKAEVGAPMREIVRVLKPGGALCLGLIEGEGEAYRESSGVAQPRLFSYYRKEEAEQLLADQGFRIEYFEAFTPHSKTYLNFVCSR